MPLTKLNYLLTLYLFLYKLFEKLMYDMLYLMQVNRGFLYDNTKETFIR